MASPCPPPPTITTSYDLLGSGERQRKSGCSPLSEHLVAQHADPVDLDLDHVARCKHDLRVAEEADALVKQREEIEERLTKLLVPKDPNDDRDTIVEVKAGEGGDESALFAGDLLRMYQRYAERHGWKTEIIDSTLTGLGGVKDATMAVKAGKGGTGAWSRLKYEGGVHRVQRVPVTESQGRIHTSAAGVLVTPEADPVDVQINDAYTAGTLLVNWMPYAHLELQLMERVQIPTGGSAANTFFAQLHYFL